MAEDGDMGLKNYALKATSMESPNMDCIKEKQKLKEYLGFTKISIFSKYDIPEVGKRGLKKIVKGQDWDDSCVSYSRKISEVESDNSVIDGGGLGIVSQEEEVLDVSNLKEESNIASFRRATAMLFFEGEYNCRHVVPVGSSFQAEIPHLESEYVKNTESVGIPRMSKNHDKSRRRVNKVSTFPNDRRTRLCLVKEEDLC